MATNTCEDDADAEEFLYKQWLPLKFDETASSHLESIESDEWPEIKEQLSELLIDPHERMRWRARQTTIKWDGKESLHTLATRIVQPWTRTTAIFLRMSEITSTSPDSVRHLKRR